MVLGTDFGSDDPSERGAAPLLGIVLLFGMVFIGVTLLFITGTALLDSLESEGNAERAHQYMSQTDKVLSTAAVTESVHQLDVPPGAEASIVDDGEIEVVWYNASASSDPPWDDESLGCTAPENVSGELNALEYELDGRTIAHQGGGVWERKNGATTVVSGPNVGYDGETLQLKIMQLEEGKFDGELTARANHSKSTALTRELKGAGDDCRDKGDVALKVQSSYHDGWYEHFQDSFDTSDGNVTVKSDSETSEDETVVVVIEGVRETVENPTFVVAEDKGLKEPGKGGDPIDPPVLSNESSAFRIGGMIENVGDEVDTQDVGITIEDESEDGYSDDVELTLDPEEEQDISEPSLIGQFPSPSSAHFEFTEGETYEYTIWTEDDELDGSFYFGKKGTHLDLTNDDVETSEEDGNVTISVDVRNVGIENATNADVTLEFDDLDVSDNQTLDVEYGGTGTIEWTVNKSALPAGEHDVTIDTGDETASATVEGEATGEGGAFVVVEDEGVGEDQLVADDGTMFEVSAAVQSTYPTDDVRRNVTLTIPNASVNVDEPVTLDSGERETVTFDVDPDAHDFDHGRAYEYDVQADGTGLNETGRFYFGKPGSEFELSNANASDGDDEIVLTADLHNTGVDDDEQNVTLELDYRGDLPDELEDDPYAEPIDAGSTTEWAFGKNDTIELPINESVLIDGTYDATIKTEDDKVDVRFNVTAGVDPGRVGLGDVEDAEVTVEVLGSQVSGDGTMWIRDGWGWDLVPVHNLAPMTLDVVTNEETIHSFENPDGGNNINTGPTWQEKSADSYAYNFTVENETELTLRNTRYGTCQGELTDPNSLPHYDGPTDSDFAWCEDVSGAPVFGPIDASQDANLQNVRVRSAENNTIPALPAGTDQQLSATEVLEQRGLIEEGEDELDLEPGEFVFLIENTKSTEEEDIDALWDDAIEAYEDDPHDTHDPDFNDLIVYVEVERAGVDPGKPSITISPSGGDGPDIDPGDGSDVGGVDDPDVDLGGSASDGGSPDLEPGESDSDNVGGSDTVIDDTGIDIDSDHIVVG